MGIGASVGVVMVFLVSLILSSLPLYFAVKLLGGRASILRIIITNVLVGFIGGILASYFGFGILLIFLVMIVLYSFFHSKGCSIRKALIAFLDRLFGFAPRNQA